MLCSIQNSKFFVELGSIFGVAQFQLHDVVVVGPFLAFEREHLGLVHLTGCDCGRFDFHGIIFARGNDCCLDDGIIELYKEIISVTYGTGVQTRFMDQNKRQY